METGCVRKTSRSASPIPTDATTSAAMPASDHTAEHVDPECADGPADEDENHPGRHDRVRRRRDTYQSECPGSAEIGDRRVGHEVGADRHPAAEPAVGAAHQAAAPLVRAARDRKLRGELGVHRQQQTLAGERDRQHPDPGRACHDGADEHDRVEPDDGRGCGEPHRSVVEEAKPTRELLPVPQLREPLRVRIERRRGYETHVRCAPSSWRRACSIARATSTRDETPSFWKM